MKKTLITLLALSGGLFAETESALTLEDAVQVLNSTTATYSFGEDTTTSSFITLLLNDETLTKLQSDATINRAFVSYSISGSSNSTYVALDDTTYSGNAQIRISNSAAGGYSSRYWSAMDAADYATQLASAQNAALTLGTKSDGSAIVQFAIIGSNGAVTILETWTKTGMDSYTNLTQVSIDSETVNSAYLYTGAWTQSDVTAITTAALKTMVTVPEPTTATLSLLALAGLAARRRRK